MNKLMMGFTLASLLAACGSDPKLPTTPSANEPIRYEDAPTGAIKDESAAPPLAAEPEALPAPVEPPPPPPPVPVAAPATPAQMLALQPPAWVEREGVSTAIKAGLDIYAGDRLRTGAKGRLHITLDDGSVIKLGENAELTLDQLRSDQASLTLAKGAVRYTAVAGSRRATLNIGGVIVADLGTADVFADAEGRENELSLVSGDANANVSGSDPMTLRKSLDTVMLKNGTAASVTPVSKKQQIAWLAKTDLPASVGTITAQGTYALGLSAEHELSRARTTVEKLWKAGYPAEAFEVQIKGKTWYRVVIRGFNSPGDATTFKRTAAPGLGFKTAWLLRPEK